MVKSHGVIIIQFLIRNFTFLLLNKWVPVPLVCESKGRESITARSLGGNAAELVDWAYRGTHETSNQWIGFNWKPTQPLVVSWIP